jgi:hypothetical protein
MLEDRKSWLPRIGPLGAAMAAATAVALGLAGCSSAIDSPYPAVHDMPLARPQPPMTPEELKRATDVLLADRDKLSSEAQAAAAAAAAASGSPPPVPPPATAAQPLAIAPTKGQKTGAGAKP